MAAPIINLESLAVGYGRVAVLQKIDYSIQRGSSVGLLGANGSGKTTLLKTIAGILPALSGQIVLNPPGAVVGYVPQRESLDSPFLLSSAEIVRMGLCGRIGPARFIGREDRAFVRECLRQTEAEDLARKPFALLSGGQKQRVLIARALAARPDILLLDEPTAGVDPSATEGITNLLRRLRETGMTILMVNHELPVVRRTTDQVLWIRSGRLSHGDTMEMLSEEVLERMSLQME